MRIGASLTAVVVGMTVSGYTQSPTEFVGTLETELTPGGAVLPLSLSRAPDGTPLKVRALLSAGENLWVGDLAVGAAPPRPLYVVAAAGEARAVMVDGDGDGTVSPDERTAIRALTKPPGAAEATIRIAVKGTAFPQYPVRVWMNRGAIQQMSRAPSQPPVGQEAAASAPFVMVSVEAFAVGQVKVDGRTVRVQLLCNPSDSTLNPVTTVQYVDCNGDGEFDTDSTSWEVGYDPGEPVVFRLESGDQYVSVRSVDPAAKTITLIRRAASEYLRFELRLGSTLPDFAFTALDGSARRLSDFRGKYLVIDFWGMWCGPCVAEIPFLKKAYEAYKDKGLEILGMDKEVPDVTPEDFSKGLEKVRSFIAEQGIGWMQAQTQSIKSLYEKRFQIRAWPTVILLDRKGTIISVSRTARGEPSLRGGKLLETLAVIFSSK